MGNGNLPGRTRVYTALRGRFTLAAVLIGHGDRQAGIVLNHEAHAILNPNIVRSALTNIPLQVNIRRFCRIGAPTTRILCTGTQRCTKLGPSSFLLSLCYNVNAVKLSVLTSYGHLINIRIIPRTIRNTGRATTQLKLSTSETSFHYRSTNTTTTRLTTRNTHPSIVIMSPPHGNYSRTALATVTRVTPHAIIVIDYGTTATTESTG